ncbi:MAG: thiamine pyrophosphate-binding protein [Acidimicrobiales bacterium]
MARAQCRRASLAQLLAVRTADYIAQLLAEGGIEQVFMVTGGGAMHLNDAFGREPRLRTTFCHHEQACAMAAESYARLSNRPALVNVTTGPGGINALNGVFGAYVDSIPLVVVSGQVKRETLVTSYDLPLRQLGDQEVDIVRMAAPVCKRAIQLEDPRDTRSVVESALRLATSGRPGPVWIDVPIDVQAAPLDPDDQANLAPPIDGDQWTPASEVGVLTGAELRAALERVLATMAAAERPVVLAGAGVRLAGAHDTFMKLIEKLGVPVTTGWNAHDSLWDSHRQYAGRPGTIGDRAGNFAVQNADFLLVLGSRLNIRQISYNWASFARAAHVTMIDVDRAELEKPTLAVDHPVHADLGQALEVLVSLDYDRQPSHAKYLDWCRERVARYPVVLPEYSKSGEPVNPYIFVQALFDQLEEGDVVVTGDGTACVVTFQAAHLRRGQRLYTNSGCASMGYDLPAAIGAAMTGEASRVICIAGDGSIMLNLQELQTIAGNALPVKVFVLNNNGYSSIRQTQRNYFPDNVVGCGPESGLTFPDFVRLGTAFGVRAARCSNHATLASAIRQTLEGDGPQLLEVVLDPEQQFSPKLASRQLPDGRMVSSALEDLAPFLPRSELAENMLIPMVDE